MTTYYAHADDHPAIADGSTERIDEVTQDRIHAAYAAGDCRIIHGYGDNRTTSYLSIAGRDWDTRDQCYRMSGETWTMPCESLSQALRLAYVSDPHAQQFR